MASSSKAENRVVSDDEWEKMKTMISDQLDNVTSSLDELRENGSLETIAQMIRRGDSCPSARLQAWYHGMLEAEYCNRPYSVSQKLQFMYKKHTSNGPNDAPSSFILDTSLTAESSKNEEWKRRSGRPLESPESVVARLEGKRNLSVVERQELWLAKKNLKAATKAKSTIKEEELHERAKSAPNLSRSRQSFSMTAQEKNTLAAAKSSTADGRRRSSTVARKRTVPSIAENARPNISNQKETKTRKRQRRGTRGPISDPFSQRIR